MSAQAAAIRRPRPRGFTLLEMIIAAAISSVIVYATIQITTISQKELEINSIQSQLQSKALDTVDRIVRDIKDSGASPHLRIYANSTATQESLMGSKVEITKCMGFVSGQTQWGDGDTVNNKIVYELKSTIRNVGGVKTTLYYIDRYVKDQSNTIIPGSRETLVDFVSQYLEAGSPDKPEEPNNYDDNRNGVSDEPGLFLQIAGNMVSVGLRVEKQGFVNFKVNAAGQTNYKKKKAWSFLCSTKVTMKF